jgi:hypothetical protein
MFDGNIGFLAYTNGVYSFEENRLLTFEEAREKKIRFTRDTGRVYTAKVDETLKEEVQRRVIDAFLPDTAQQKMFLNKTARALAGMIGDKRWYANMGPRNCSKSMWCTGLMNTFGPSFVQLTNVENLLTKNGRPQDAAKAQSWLQDLEFARIAYTQEMPTHGNTTIDGEMIKRICSAGDRMQVRKNYTDEMMMRSQAAFDLYFNHIDGVNPSDAYQTMIGFKFDNEFRDQFEFDELKARGVEPPANWHLKDPSIAKFILREDVRDAITSIIFGAYTPEKQDPPQRVIDDTNSIKGPAKLSDEDRFAEIVIKGEKTDVVFYAEIVAALITGGLGKLGHPKIDTQVKQVYQMVPSRPSRKNEQGKSVQGEGFKGLRISDSNFNAQEERLKHTEQVKQKARFEFSNPNQAHP